MGCLVVLAFLLLPFAEYLALSRLAVELGWADALTVAAASMLAGLVLSRQQRASAALRMASAAEPARLARAAFDATCISAARALFFFPGLVSDGLGLLLLLPPVRTALARVLGERLRAGARGGVVFRSWTVGGGPPGGGSSPVRPRGPVIDVEAREVERPAGALEPGERDEGP
jgi:UPF0716 protein FxsA